MLVSAVVTTKKVSGHCQKCLDTGGGRKGMDDHHWLRNNASDWKFIAITPVLSPHEGSFLLESKPHEFLLQLYSLSLKSKMVEYFQPENQLVCHNFKFYTYIFEWQVYQLDQRQSAVYGILKGRMMDDSKENKTWQSFHVKAHQFNLIFSLETGLSKQWLTDRRVTNQVFVVTTPNTDYIVHHSTNSPVKKISCGCGSTCWWCQHLGGRGREIARCWRPAWST